MYVHSIKCCFCGLIFIRPLKLSQHVKAQKPKIQSREIPIVEYAFLKNQIAESEPDDLNKIKIFFNIFVSCKSSIENNFSFSFEDILVELRELKQQKKSASPPQQIAFGLQLEERLYEDR